MDSNILFGLILPAGFGVFIGVIIGFLAKRKGRNGWMWGISFGFAVSIGFWLMFSELASTYPCYSFVLTGLLGFLSGFTGMIVLAFLKPLCPKCKNGLTINQWKEKQCPHCRE